MLTKRDREAGYCQLFAESLYGSALEWFSRLEPNSIDSFAKLSATFLKHYSMFFKDEPAMADLWGGSNKKKVNH